MVRVPPAVSTDIEADSCFLISADIVFAFPRAQICDNTRVFDRQGHADEAGAKTQGRAKQKEYVMSSLLAKVLVATDPRINPAADLFGRAASDLGRSLGNVCSGIASLFESSPEQISLPYQSYSTAPARPPLECSTMPHRDVPDFLHFIRADISRLRERHSAQQKAFDATRQLIESHERIDLRQLEREIGELQDEIDECLSSEADLVRESNAYCEEGMLRNVFVHGLTQISLSHRIREVRKRKAALIAKQDALRELVEKRSAFDFAAKKHLLETQEEELDAIWQRCLGQESRLERLDRQMQDFVDRIADTTSRLNRQIDKCNALNRYEAELNVAANAYERRLVHKKCEAEFGDGSVGRLRSRVMSRIKALSSLYDKQVRQGESHARAIV